MFTGIKSLSVLLSLLFLAPLGAHGAVSWAGGWAHSWATADWSSAGIIEHPADHPKATIRVYGARAGRWKGIFSLHSWIVIKRAGARRYDRYEVVGWGRPVRRNNHPPDGRWYGNEPKLIFRLDGPRAAALIPKLERAIAQYRYNAYGDYRIWPGPNSNSFVADVLARVPELGAHLPPTAVGRDFPVDGKWLRATASGTGFRLTAGGYLGMTLGWVEGLEINLLGVIAGLDIRRPALTLPGFGRIGMGRS